MVSARHLLVFASLALACQCCCGLTPAVYARVVLRLTQLFDQAVGMHLIIVVDHVPPPMDGGPVLGLGVLVRWAADAACVLPRAATMQSAAKADATMPTPLPV